LTHPRVRLSGRSSTVVTALVTAAALASCSSPSPSASTTTNATTTTTTGPSQSTTTVATTSPTTTTTVPGCTGSNYVLSQLGSQGAAGTFELTFGFRNTSTATCALFGYPGLQLLDGAGNNLTTTTVEGGTYSFTNLAPTNVSVGPSATAYFNVAYSDVPSGTETSCPTAAAIQAIAPNTTTPLRVNGSYTVCNHGTLTVSPVFGHGSSDTQTTAPPGA